MGGVDKVKRQHDQGRLTVRERIDKLIDKGSFHEIGAVSGIGEYDPTGELKTVTPANCVFGRARVDGRTVVVVGDDFTVRGGSADASISAKPLMAEEIAHDFRLPIVRIIEGSGGGGSVKTIETKGAANLPAASAVPAGSLHDGESLARAGGRSRPRLGCGSGRRASGRQPLLHHDPDVRDVRRRPAGGEGAGPKSLEGGARRRRHPDQGRRGRSCRRYRGGGVCLRAALPVLSPSSVYDLPPTLPCIDNPERSEEALMNAVPRNRKQVYKMRPIIEQVVDKGSFFEVASNFGKPIIVGLIGLDAEKAATIRHGVRAMAAVNQTTVPWCTVILRNAFGVAGVVHQPADRFSIRYAWPSAYWGSLPLEGGIEAAYRADIDAAEDKAAKLNEIQERLNKLRSPFRSAEKFWVEEIIDPRKTRSLLCEFARLAEPLRKAGPPENMTIRP